MNQMNGQVREQLEELIRSSFTVDQLSRILTYKLDRDLSNISLPPNKIIAVWELMNAACREGWIHQLLQALRAERPLRDDLHRIIDAALATLNAPNSYFVAPTPKDPTPLPPCDWCWWRTLGLEEINELSQGLKRNQGKLAKRDRIVRLTDRLPFHLANDTNAALGREIVEAANFILKAAYGTDSKRKLIVANFDGKEIENDWAGTLIEANQRGSVTLIALLLAIFLLNGRLKSLADANLQRLHMKTKRGYVDVS
jgi:hypothetical protein